MLYILVIVLFVYILSIILFNYTCQKSKIDEEKMKKSLNKIKDKYKEKIMEAIVAINKFEKEEVEIKSSDGLLLKGHLIKGKSKNIIICCHGYHSCYQFDFSIGGMNYLKKGYSVLFLDQRAHQDSKGVFTTFGVKECYDLKKWIEFISNKYKDSKILLTGISMGASTVMYSLGLKLPKNVVGAVCDCGFTRPIEVIKHTANKMIPYCGGIIAFLINLGSIFCTGKSLAKISTKKTLKENTIPLMILHGTSDKVVPVEMGRLNNQYNKESKAKIKKYVEIEGAGHGMSFLVDEKKCSEELDDFLKKINF